MRVHNYSSVERHKLIVEAIRGTAVASQEELQSLLRKRGLRVAQATLSRDLHELGVAKTPNGYILPADLAGSAADSVTTPHERRQERLAQLVREYVTDVVKAATIVVVKTTIAAAQPVARAIDEASLPEVLGTLGGDDTIFLATADDVSAQRLIRRLRELQHPSRSRRPRA